MQVPENTGHVVIVGAPDGYVESLVIVLGDERAVPLFDSIDEAKEFLGSLTGLGEEWFPAEIPAARLLRMLDEQPEGVRYVALSPPPEDLEGGMEFRLLEIEAITALLTMQAAREEDASATPERRGFFRRLLGR